MAAADGKIALIAGASGLVGRLLVRQLLDSPRYARVIALSRRPLPLEHPRLANRILQFDALGTQLRNLRCDEAFCTLGTTLKQAGSAAAFRAVDLDLVRRFAETALGLGAQCLVHVSSAGANRNAKNLYLRTKGEAEAALEALRAPALHLMQPGLLLGNRVEWRPLEWLAQLAMPLVNPLLLGPAAQWRAIRADALATAMRQVAIAGRRGIYRYAGAKLHAYARPIPNQAPGL